MVFIATADRSNEPPKWTLYFPCRSVSSVVTRNIPAREHTERHGRKSDIRNPKYRLGIPRRHRFRLRASTSIDLKDTTIGNGGQAYSSTGVWATRANIFAGSPSNFLLHKSEQKP